MSNLRRNQVIRLLLVGITTVPLVWLGYLEYQGSRPLSQSKEVLSCLVKVVVLADMLMKQKDSDPN